MCVHPKWRYTKLLVKKFRCYYFEATKQDLLKISNVFKPTNERVYFFDKTEKGFSYSFESGG